MAIQLTEMNGDRILDVAVSDKLTDADYQCFVSEFESLAKRHGKIRVLFEMSQFHRWEAKAAWDDLKFSVKHFHDIERLAMVGEKKWQAWMAEFSKPFTAAEVRYFDKAEAEQARRWLAESGAGIENTGDAPV